VNPSTGFTLRFHHRDHLGSSAVSRAYSPGFDEVMAGAEPFYLKVADGNMTLYAKPAKATLFDPNGEALGSVAGEPKPRYTDHEYDEASGLNYMKGRYQLANYAKFNRPDPMRDWDWENPHSINLYEYVRNNPIMFNDPDGFTITEDILKSAEKDINRGGFWNKVKGGLKFAGAVLWESAGAAATNELAEDAVNGEQVSVMAVVMAFGDLPGLKQAKAAGKVVKGGTKLAKGALKHADEAVDAAGELRKVEKSVKKGKPTKHIQNRHVDRKKYPKKSKFKKPNQVEKLNGRTVKKPDRVVDQGNRVRYEKDFGREIGTKGERTNVTVIDKKTKKRVTQFPKK